MSEENLDLIDKETFSHFWTLAQDVWEEKNKATFHFYRKRLSKRMGTELFRRAATNVLEREEFFPTVQEIVDEANRLRDWSNRRKGAIVARRRAEREKRRLEEEAREMFREEELSGREVGRLVANGEIDIAARIGRALPPEREASYRSAGRYLLEGEVEEESDG